MQLRLGKAGQYKTQANLTQLLLAGNSATLLLFQTSGKWVYR